MADSVEVHRRRQITAPFRIKQALRQPLCANLIRTAIALTARRPVAYLRHAGQLVKLAKVREAYVPGATGLPRGSE
jgi:hypothetical protein